MRKMSRKKPFDHSGSSFDRFLESEGIRDEVEAVAIKRVLAWQVSQEMRQQKKTKKEMARALDTSRSQLDRLLDPIMWGFRWVRWLGPRKCRARAWCCGFGTRRLNEA